MIGGDLGLIHPYNKIPNERDSQMFKNDYKRAQIPLGPIIIVLINAAISSDPFYMGYAFRCGIFQTIFICIVVLFLSITSFKLFIKSWSFEKSYTYRDIWVGLYGPKYSIVPSLFVLSAYMSVAVLCTKEIYQNHIVAFEALIGYIPNVIHNKWVFVYISTASFSFPLLFRKSAHEFKGTSILSKLSLLIAIGIICNKAFSRAKIEGWNPNQRIRFWSNDVEKSMVAFELFNTVFFINPIVPLVAKNIINPTQSKITSMVQKTTIINAIICIIAGLGTYLTVFDNNNGENILFSFPKTEASTRVALVAALLSNAFLCAFYVWLIAREISSLMHHGSEEYLHSRILCGILVICLNAGLNFVNPTITFAFRVIGSFSFIVLNFVLPAIFYITANWGNNILWSSISIVHLIIAFPASTALIIYQIRTHI